MSPLRSPILLCNGKANFFIDQKVLLITVLLVAAQVLLKIKVSIEPCLVSVVVLMGCCSGTGEYEAAKSQYSHYKKLDYTTATTIHTLIKH